MILKDYHLNPFKTITITEGSPVNFIGVVGKWIGKSWNHYAIGEYANGLKPILGYEYKYTITPVGIATSKVPLGRCIGINKIDGPESGMLVAYYVRALTKVSQAVQDELARQRFEKEVLEAGGSIMVSGKNAIVTRPKMSGTQHVHTVEIVNGKAAVVTKKKLKDKKKVVVKKK